MQTNVSRLPTLAYLAGKLAAAKRETAGLFATETAA